MKTMPAVLAILVCSALSVPPASGQVLTPSSEDYSVDVRGDVTGNDGAFLTLQAIGSPSRSGTAAGTVDAGNDRMKLVTFSGELRTIGVASGASIWIGIEADGELLLSANGDQERLQGDSDWTPRSYTLPVPSIATEVAFGAALGPGGGRLEVRDLRLSFSPLPDRRMSPRAAAFLNETVAIVKTNALRSARLDWAQVGRELQELSRGAAEPGDVHVTIRYLLALLQDDHSGLLPPSEAQAIREGRRENIRPEVNVEEGIGFITLPSFAGTNAAAGRKYAVELHRALREAASSVRCGWLVDLRENRGGNMVPMLNGLEPLLGDGTLGWFVRARTQTPWTAHGVEGVRPPRQLKPLRAAWIAVLTGPRTASSGEVVAISFKGRPRTRTFGGPTRGLTTANEIFDLSDGSSLALAVAREADRSGRIYGGSIQPDEISDDAQAMRQASAWLRASSGCE